MLISWKDLFKISDFPENIFAQENERVMKVFNSFVQYRVIFSVQKIL